MIARLLLCLVLLGMPAAATAQDAQTDTGPSAAQDAPEGAEPPADTGDPIDQFLADQVRLPPPDLVFLDYLDADGKAALQASLKEYYRYHETGFIHRRAVFDWQLLSSKIIFCVVIFLVMTGVYFSWLQFMAAARQSQARAGAATGPSAEQAQPAEPKPTTTFEATLQGIKVSSPVLGVVILVISLAFFYLYLQYIYPIAELF